MAIAFDAASDSNVNPGTSLTFAHTCTGSNLCLVVAICANTSDTITGVTYNSVAMTLVAKRQAGGTGTLRWFYLYYLNAPSTGANNIVISNSASSFIGAAAASYTGVSQTGQPEAQADNDGTSTSVTGTVTVATANAWIVMGAKGQGGSIAAGSGATERADDSLSICGIYDGNGAKSTGSNAMTVTAATHVSNMACCIISIAPVAATTTAPPIFRRPTRIWRR